MGEQDVIRVVAAARDAVVRTGLELVFDHRYGFELVDICSDAAGVLAAIAAQPPSRPLHVAVVEHEWTDRAVLGAIATLRRRGGPVALVLARDPTAEIIGAVWSSGGAGVAPADADPAALQRAVRAVAAGQAWFELCALERAIDDGRSRLSPDAWRVSSSLTRRELQILRLLAAGCSNAKIAGELGLAIGTVKAHLSRIFAKLGVQDRLSAALCAIRLGMVAT